MVFNHTYRIGLEDCGKENEATNKAILTILEDIAGLHSATVGLGLNEINKTGCAWVILKWQVQIIKRPEYNDELNVFTWSTTANKLFADRDFKVLDSNGQTVIIATSRWIYMDINKRRPVRITAEIMDRYESEPERRVFSEEITKNVREMCIEANVHLSEDMEKAVRDSVDTEDSPLGKQILRQLCENLDVAGENDIPICQDTGMAVFFVNIGQDVHILSLIHI